MEERRRKKEMENFPLINIQKLNGEEREATMDNINDACEKMGLL